MIPRYEDPDEQARHDKAISSLAFELRLPEGRVRFVYEIELTRITTGARVTEYLALLARKGARECLLCAGRSVKAKCATRARCPVDSLNAATLALDTRTGEARSPLHG